MQSSHITIIALLFFTGFITHETKAQYYSYYYPSYYPYYYGAYSYYYPYYGYYYYGKREVDWNQAPQGQQGIHELQNGPQQRSFNQQ